MRAIPVAIRTRILELYKQGKSTQEIAQYCGFCVAAVRRVRQQFHERRTLEPRTHLCGRKTLLTEERKQQLRKLLSEQSDATLAELGVRLDHSRKRFGSRAAFSICVKPLVAGLSRLVLRNHWQSGFGKLSDRSKTCQCHVLDGNVLAPRLKRNRTPNNKNVQHLVNAIKRGRRCLSLTAPLPATSRYP